MGPSIVTFPNGEQGACKAKRISNRARKKAGTDQTRTGRRNNETRGATSNVTVNKHHTQSHKAAAALGWVSVSHSLAGLAWLVNGNRSLLVTVTATIRNCYSSCMEIMMGANACNEKEKGREASAFLPPSSAGSPWVTSRAASV